MNTNPCANTQLYGMDRFFNELVNLYDKNLMPNKILLSGKKGLGKSTLAYHIINYALSANEDFKYDCEKFFINKLNKSYKLVNNKTHPNFLIIDVKNEKKTIDIAQIREMIIYTNKSSFNNNPRFILIDNIENLNKNSLNALLKVVEEPNENIFFILINNNEKKILPTLISRCLVFKINLTFDETIKIVNKLLNQNILDLINKDLISYYNTPGEIINLLTFANEKKLYLKEQTLVNFLNLIIDNNYYKKSILTKNFIFSLVELFFLKKYRTSSFKISLLSYYFVFINKVNNIEKYNLDEESIFLELKSKLLNE